MSSDRPTVDPDIRRARSLPPEIYRSPEVHAALLERAFVPGWHWIESADPPLETESVHPFVLLEGTLDEPLVLTRDAKGEIRALSNVCTHRGNLVVEQRARCRRLRCRYHGRRFGLDGRMVFMPGFGEAADFPGERDHLPRVATETWGPLRFVSLTPALDFRVAFAPLAERVGWIDWRNARFKAGRDYEVAANWALYCDNYLEGFHIPFVHPSLSRVLDPRGYRTALFPGGSLQIGVAAREEDAFDLPAGHPDAGERVAGYYFWFFPNLMLNFYPWGLSLNVVKPLGVDKTRVSFFEVVLDAARRERGAGSGIHTVEMEDEAVVEATGRGVRSRLYRGGRYSPTRETGVHHFHRLLTAALAS